MRGVTSVSTVGMSRPEWLALRRKTIGGSDAAGIIGLSKWSTPYTVWADKTGRLPDKPDTEALRIGRDLEDYVARRWMEATGKKVRRLNAMLYNEQYPFAHADIDRDVIGEQAGLECKTIGSMNVRRFRDVEFPEEYYAQCVHYLAVTGYERWYLSVLVFGRGLYNFVLERDQAEIDALMTAEADFYGLVQNDTPPPVDGLSPTTAALTTIYADSSGRYVELFGRDQLLDEYFQAKDQQQALDLRIKEIENIIKGDMKEAETASCGRYGINWKPSTRRSFQQWKFQEDHPDIDLEPYYKTSIFRTFRVKKEEP